MNIPEPSANEPSQHPFAPSLASGEVTDRAQGSLPGFGDPRPTNGSESSLSKSHKHPSSPDLKQLATIAAVVEKKESEEDDMDETGSPKNIGAILTDAAAVVDASEQPEGDEVAADSTAADGAEEPVKKKTRKKWKKPVGKPNRPLSAYNLYFKKERGIMLGDAAELGDAEPGKKRVHRKTHGKIGFAEMARLIGQKWKQLSDEEKKPFEEIAKKEKEKYAVLLSDWREEQKKKSLTISLGRKGKKGDDDDDIDPLVKSINEDREELLKRHSAFRMQMKMYEEMAINRLAREGRPMPALDYMRNMPDDRSNPFFGSGRMSQYPNAAEDSGRNILQHMLSLSGQEGPGPMSRMMHSSRMDGPMGSSMGNTMGPMGGPMGGSIGGSMGMGNSMGHSHMGGHMGNHPMGHQMGHSMGANPMNNHMGPMGNNMNYPMGNQMGNSMNETMPNHPMGNNMNNQTGNSGMGGGMIPVNNGGPQMPSSPYPAQYEMDRFPPIQRMSMGMGNSNRLSPVPNSQPRNHMDMPPPPLDGGHDPNMEAAMMRRYHQNRYGNM